MKNQQWAEKTFWRQFENLNDVSENLGKKFI